jgi:N-acetylmuramoyl-L-alanine amidase
MRQINKIIIHCSATPEGKDYTVADITKWHKQRGFTEIGYHYIIYRDGTVNLGRDIAKIGAHCEGQNTNSIGICYIGGLATDGKTPKDTRTDTQKKAMITLVDALLAVHPTATVHGHNEFSNKACPGFNVKKEFQNK